HARAVRPSSMSLWYCQGRSDSARGRAIMSNWTRVPSDVAYLHPLYGIKGWAVVPAIGLGITPFAALYNLTFGVSAGPVPEQFAWLSPVLVFEKAALVVFGVSAALLLVALLNHRPWFRAGYTVYALVGAAWPIGDAMVAASAASGHG